MSLRDSKEITICYQITMPNGIVVNVINNDVWVNEVKVTGLVREFSMSRHNVCPNCGSEGLELLGGRNTVTGQIKCSSCGYGPFSWLKSRKTEVKPFMSIPTVRVHLFICGTFESARDFTAVPRIGEIIIMDCHEKLKVVSVTYQWDSSELIQVDTERV